MITWTTAREVAFEKICSSSLLEEVTEFDAGTFGIPTFFAVTRASSTGRTDNATGYTEYVSYSLSIFTEVPDVTSTYTYTIGFFPVTQSTTSTNSTSGYTINTSTSVELSTVQHFTFFAQTTTTEQQTASGTATASSTQTSTRWTTALAFTDTNVTEFAITTSVKTQYVSTTALFTKTQIVTTTSETTKGNAIDTIYMAEPTEILWVINQNPQWSRALTDNATSITQTTISDLRETVNLVAAAEEPLTIASSESISSYTFTGSSGSSSGITTNPTPNLVNAETASQAIAVSAPAQSQSSTLQVSGHPEVVCVGGTETAATTSAAIATATQTDVYGGSWQQTFLVYSTVTNTKSIDNAAPTVTIDGGTSSSCYGNTTKEGGFVGGSSAMASIPSVSVYSPAGVKLNDAVGLRFTGGGISTTDFNGFEAITISYLSTAHDGELTKYTTVSPMTPTWFTISGNSFTYLTTTMDDEETVATELLGEFEIDGQTWQTVARTRGDGLVGGDLAESETALIRINRGLYKNQSGGTSFFDGNDTTYTGTKATSFWYPISYLEPFFARQVIAVPRNTSSWPT